MTKNQKILLGVGLVAVGGYLYYKSRKSFANAGGFSIFSQPKQTPSSTPTNYSSTYNVEGCKKFNPNCKCYDRECSKCSCPKSVEPFYYLVPNPQVHP